MMVQQARSEHSIEMERFYRYLGISRQGAHQGIESCKREKEMMAEIEHLVREYRLTKDRRAGSRSLFYNLGIKEAYHIGVTKFERLMSRYDQCLLPLHVRITTTTSCMQSWNYPNLTEGLKIQSINELVVGDLTYIVYGKDRYYLFCLTDVYSGRIVGHCFSNRMRSIEAKIALDRWIYLRGKQKMINCIHHTDGGSQYFSSIYLTTLQDLGVQVSVAKNCLQNGYAEQRNGLFKHHLLPTIKAGKKQSLEKEIESSIKYYNFERKQEGFNWRSPVEYERYTATLEARPMMVLYQPQTHLK
jgi:putative transposase